MSAPPGAPRGGPATIAIMGLDGTGKSTQADAREGSERAAGRRAIRIHHASTKVPILGGLKRRYHARLIALLKRRGSHVEWTETEAASPSGGGTWIGRLMGTYLLTGSLLKSLWCKARYRHGTVILDRCLLDDVVKVRWRFGSMAWLGTWLIRSAPRPDLIVVLEGDPAVTFARKKAMNCTYAEYLGKGEILAGVLQDAAVAGWRITRLSIDGQGPEAVHERILQLRSERPGVDGVPQRFPHEADE